MTNEITYGLATAKTATMYDEPIRRELTQKNMFYTDPIFMGDADEGEEGIVGHQRHYKVGEKVIITEDDNSNQNEMIIATLSEEEYEKEYGN